MAAKNGCPKSPNSLTSFVGPAQQTFATFLDLAKYSMNHYWSDWRNYRNPQSYIVPPVFYYKQPDRSDADFEQCVAERNHLMDEAKRNGQSIGKIPSDRLVIDRRSNEAEHLIYDVIVKLIDARFRAPFIAAHNLRLSDLHDQGRLELLFPQSKDSIQNFKSCMGEYDFVLIGPRIGTVFIEVKHSYFNQKRHFTPGQCHLPDDFSKGLLQLDSADVFMNFLAMCSENQQNHNATIRKILFTPNLERFRFEGWLETLTDQQRGHIHEKLGRVILWFKEDVANLLRNLQILQSDNRSAGVQKNQYEVCAPLIVGFASVMIYKTSAAAISVQTDVQKLSSLTAAHKESDRIDCQDPLGLLQRSASSERQILLSKLIIFTPDQLRALKGPNEQVLMGVAGTGKTIIIQAKALELLRAGQRVAVLTTEHFAKSYENLFASHGYQDTARVLNWESIRYALVVFVANCGASLLQRIPSNDENEEERIIAYIENFIDFVYINESIDASSSVNGIHDIQSLSYAVDSLKAIITKLQYIDSIFVDDAFDIETSVTFKQQCRQFKVACLALVALGRKFRPGKVTWFAVDPMAELYDRHITNSSTFHMNVILQNRDIGFRSLTTVYLRSVMRCPEEVFKLGFKDQIKTQWMEAVLKGCISIERPILGHKVQGCRKYIAANRIGKVEYKFAYDTLWESVREELDDLVKKGCNFDKLGLLVVDEHYGLFCKPLQRDFHVRYQRYLESHSIDSTTARVHSFFEVSSMEWPIVLLAMVQSSNSSSELSAYMSYRGCSRATGKLILVHVSCKRTKRKIHDSSSSTSEFERMFSF